MDFHRKPVTFVGQVIEYTQASFSKGSRNHIVHMGRESFVPPNGS